MEVFIDKVKTSEKHCGVSAVQLDDISSGSLAAVSAVQLDDAMRFACGSVYAYQHTISKKGPL
jgi:hypothetical protein